MYGEDRYRKLWYPEVSDEGHHAIRYHLQQETYLIIASRQPVHPVRPKGPTAIVQAEMKQENEQDDLRALQRVP